MYIKMLKVVGASNEKSKNIHKVHILKLIETLNVFCKYKIAILKKVVKLHPSFKIYCKDPERGLVDHQILPKGHFSSEKYWYVQI